MSILIKGMEMPKGSRYCKFTEMNDNWERVCTIGGRYQGHSLRLCDDCPLIEVPPHGRLIDASTYIKALLYDEMTEEWKLETMTVDDYLAFAADTPPTIIEAEEGVDHE